MKNILLYIIIFTLINSCNLRKKRYWYCGMGMCYNYPEFNLQNLNGFINPQTSKPFDTVFANSKRIYDNEGKYYFEYKSTNEKNDKIYSLKNSDGNELCELIDVDFDKDPIWLNDCVIIDKSVNKKYGKCVIDLRTGKQQFYSVKGYFEAVGQDSNTAYLSSYRSLQKIGKLKVKSKHSIIGISNNGINLVLDNQCYQSKYLVRNYKRWQWRWQYCPIDKDTVNLNLFYNSNLQINGKEINKVKLEHSDFIFKNKRLKIKNSYDNSFFANNYLPYKNSIFIRLKDNDIYKLDSNNFKCVLEFITLNITGKWLNDFKIEGNYLIFKTYVDIEREEPKATSWINQNGFEIKYERSGYDLIGIVNLKTKEVFYPKIINESK